MQYSLLGRDMIVSYIPVTPERRSHCDLEKCKTPRCTQYDRKHRCTNAVALPVDAVGSQRTPSDGAHFEHAQNKRHRLTFGRRSNKSAVGSP